MKMPLTFPEFDDSDQLRDCNKADAERFLSMLGETFDFRLFGDEYSPRSLKGSLSANWEQLVALNNCGMNAFVTVNESDGEGVSAENITKVRAVFVDLDGAPLWPVISSPLLPHCVVESSKNKWHVYWLVSDCSLDQFKPIQKALAAKFEGDNAVNDLPRIMRLPGFYHLKGEPQLTTVMTSSQHQPFTVSEVVDSLSLDLSTASATQNTDRHQAIWEEGSRHNNLVSWAGSFRAAGLNYEEMLSSLTALNDSRAGGSESQESIKRIAKAYADKPAGYGKLLDPVDSVWPAAEPLRRTMPQAQQFPAEALGELLKGAHDEIQQGIQAPSALIGQSLLAAAALATQPYADVMIDGRQFPLSLFFVSIAESGERKSAVDSAVSRPAMSRQRILLNEHKNSLSLFLAERDSHAAEHRKILGCKKTSREQKREALEALGAAPVAPIYPVLMAEEPTYEGLVRALQEGYPAMGLFSDEGGRMLGGHAMNSENAVKTATGLSNLWDGKAISRTRGGDGNQLIFGKRLSMHLMIQPVLMGSLFGDEMLSGQGFLSRVLACYPESNIGNRCYNSLNLSDSPLMRAYFQKMIQIFETPLPLTDDTSNQLEPRKLVITGDAHCEYRAFYEVVERQCRPDGKYSTIKGMAAKAAEMSLRIAGVLTLVENPNATGVPAQVVVRARTLMEFYLSEALRLQAASSDTPELERAEKVLKWAERTGLVFKLQALYQNGPAAVRTKAAALGAMRILASHGLARELPDNRWEVRGGSS